MYQMDLDTLKTSGYQFGKAQIRGAQRGLNTIVPKQYLKETQTEEYEHIGGGCYGIKDESWECQAPNFSQTTGRNDQLPTPREDMLAKITVSESIQRPHTVTGQRHTDTVQTSVAPSKQNNIQHFQKRGKGIIRRQQLSDMILQSKSKVE